MATSGPPAFEAHDFAIGEVTVATGAIELVFGGRPLRLELTATA